MALEWQRNQDRFGMRVISNPIQEDSIWMNGPPTWAYLSLELARDPATGTINSSAALTAALEPMQRMVANYRDRLGDLVGGEKKKGGGGKGGEKDKDEGGT